jgi:hypothetical protein
MCTVKRYLCLVHHHPWEYLEGLIYRCESGANECLFYSFELIIHRLLSEELCRICRLDDVFYFEDYLDDYDRFEYNVWDVQEAE